MQTDRGQPTNLLNQLHQSLAALVPDGQGMLLAVSGGCDSMVLLHAVAALQDRLPPQTIAVAHLNHGLRGAESNRDAELVRGESRRLRLPCHVQVCPPGSLQSQSHGSLEESARKHRYDFLNQLAITLSLPVVVTAHHAGDQAETVLFNLLRGTGLRGLQGMPACRPMHSGGVRLVRPLLRFESETIRQYARDHAVRYSEDATNTDTDFTRNRIRHQLLPLLASNFNPQVSAALARVAEQATEAIECLDLIADELLEKAVLDQALDVCRLSLDELRKHQPALCRHSLNRLWIRLDWPRQGMTSEHWQRLADVIAAGVATRQDLPGGIRAEVAHGVMRLLKSQPRAATSEC